MFILASQANTACREMFGLVCKYLTQLKIPAVKWYERTASLCEYIQSFCFVHGFGSWFAYSACVREQLVDLYVL